MSGYTLLPDANSSYALLPDDYALSQPQTPAPEYSPTESGFIGQLQNAAAGAGKQLTDWQLALQQAQVDPGMKGDLVRGLTGFPYSTDSPQMLAALKKFAEEKAKTDAPLERTPGGFAGTALTGAAPFLTLPEGAIADTIGAGVGKIAPALGDMLRGSSLLDSAGQGAIQAAAQPLSGDQTTLGNAGLGAGLGAAGAAVANTVGGTVGKLFTAADSSLDPARAAAIQWAKEHGMPMTLSDVTGSKWLPWVESAIAAMPFGAKKYAAVAEGKNAAIDKAMQGTTGDVESLYNAAGQGNPVTIDPKFISDVQNIPNKVTMLAGGFTPTSILSTAEEYGGKQIPNPQYQDLVNSTSNPDSLAMLVKATGINPTISSAPKLPIGTQLPLSGNDLNNYGSIRSLIGKLAFGPGTNQAENVTGGALQGAFDNMVTRQVGNDVVPIAKSALPDYLSGYPIGPGQAQTTIGDLLESARAGHRIGLNTDSALLPLQSGEGASYSPLKLANALGKWQNSGDMASMPPEPMQRLSDLANMINVFRPAPSSGTAERQQAQKLMEKVWDVAKLGALGAVGGVGTEQSGGDLPLAAGGALAGMAVPGLLGSLLLARANPGAMRQTMTPSPGTANMLRQLITSGVLTSQGQ